MPSASGRCDGPRFLRDWLPAGVALAATFVASSIPGDRLPPLAMWNADKLLHAVEYAVIGALLLWPLVRTSWGSRRPVVALLAATALASAWGGLDEIHQLFTPNRSCDWRDWVADTGGALLGALVWLAVGRARARRRLLGAAPLDVRGDAR
ncbi:MAG: VanZ family protein [Deltaproteobacteria bacterium]|nr:VanZ family protein [Deltaproteobacteria bacterium]